LGIRGRAPRGDRDLSVLGPEAGTDDAVATFVAGRDRVVARVSLTGGPPSLVARSRDDPSTEHVVW
ncbi:hypothetical protein ACVU7I_14105, partial [Patulibacter sp. S7RM1-6]